MAKRRSTRKKRRPKRSRKKTTIKHSLFKASAGLAILALLVVAIGFVVHYLQPYKEPLSLTAPKSPSGSSQPAVKKPKFEIYSKETAPARKPLAKRIIPKAIPRPRPLPPRKLPNVAIILDDLGYDKEIAEKFLRLEAALTFSILPHSPFQQKIARLAHSKGLEIMLHLPMEPVEYPQVNPGPGTLLASMPPDELIDQLEKNLNTLPNIRGVNNHMGSKLTAESSQMYQIFSVLKQRGLYFIDSRTTAGSLGKPSARLFQVPFAQRDVFLDHYVEPDFIRGQIEELIRLAKQNGKAVGIMHPHPITYRILREMLPDLQDQVQLVPASKIVRPLG